MLHVAVIGIDGIGSGELNKQFLDRIMSVLHSKKTIKSHIKTIPPNSPPIWTSILSGVNPGKHGIADFINWNNYKLNNSWNVMHPRIWEILAMNKIKSLVFNALFSYPFDAMYLKNTILISGWDSPRVKIYPENIERRFLRYFPEFLYQNRKSIRNIDEYQLCYLSSALNKRIIGLKEIIDKYEPDFVFTLFSDTDWLNHVRLHISNELFNKYMDKITNSIINFIKYILNKYFDLVIIVSDHDFALYRTRLSIMKLLYNLNSRAVIFDVCNISRDKKKIPTFFVFKYLNVKAIKRIILFNNKLKSIIVSPVTKFLGYRITSHCIIGGHEPLIQGLYLDKVCRRYASFLEVLFKRFGFEAVSRDKIFWGPYLSRLPDIVFLEGAFKHRVFLTLMPTTGKGIIEHVPTIFHYPNGVFVLRGDDTVKTNDKIVIQPWDVTTTILAYMGVPLPLTADGKVIDFFSRKIKVCKKQYLALWLVDRKIHSMSRKAMYTNHNI